MESRRYNWCLIMVKLALAFIWAPAVVKSFHYGGSRRLHLSLPGGLLTFGRGMVVMAPRATAAASPTTVMDPHNLILAASTVHGHEKPSLSLAINRGRSSRGGSSTTSQPSSNKFMSKRSGFAWKAALLGVALTLAQVSMAVAAGTAAADPTAAPKLHLGQKLANALRHQTGFPDWVILMAVSALPIVELRGGIPVGIWMGMDPVTTMALACIGNFLPVPFIMLALNKLQWLVDKVQPVVEKKLKDVTGTTLNWQYLAVFVGVPLPGTGAWTGAAIAALFKMSYKDSLIGIVLGILSAGVIMTAITMAGYAGGVVVGLALFFSILQGFKGDDKKKAA